MQSKDDNNRIKILHMIPMCMLDNTSETVTFSEEAFTENTITALTKLGEILKGISARHKMIGYSIMDRGIYNSNNELLYESQESN